MNDQEFAAYLRRKVNSALNDDGDEVSARRERNMAYYRGDLFGNERPGMSKVVTRECLEAVEWAMPSVIKTLATPDSITFEPVGPEDEAAADQETEVVRHYLFEKGAGFLTLHNWCKDALMYPNGYCKLWVDECEHYTTQQYQGLTDIQVAMLAQMEGVEILAQELDESGLFTIEMRQTKTERKLCWEAVPPEEVLIDNDHHCVDLDEAQFVAHKVVRTYSELVEMGYDAEKLREISSEDDYYGSEETARRLFDETYGDEDDDISLRNYTVYECYALADRDGDGIAERRRAVLIGDELFEDEESDYCPLVAMSAIVMPHQHTGMSLIDLVADLQEVNSALYRQVLTNLYRINVPRKFVGTRALVDGGMTMDALLNQEAEIIPTEDPSAIIPEQIQPLASAILPVIQQIDGLKQLRTGINPQLALDPQVLRDTTQGQYAQATDAASQRLEMIVRVMAETGLKTAYRKAHRLIREHMGAMTTLRLRNQWVDVNPQEWKERADLAVRVGVGNQAKAEKYQTLQTILAAQMQAMQMGMPFVTPQHVFNTLTSMVRSQGERDASKYFVDPQTLPPPQPPPPDPMQELAKAQAQALMVEAQAKMQKVESERAKMQLEAELESARMQLEQSKSQMEAFKAQQEIQASREAAALDFRIKSAELEGKAADASLKQAQRIKTLAEAEQTQVETARMVTNEPSTERQ